MEKKPGEFKKISGAPESSAGDDFHLLWAGRKALELLLPNSRLCALGIEGPHPEEAAIIDTEGDKLLAIDLAEYYGGEHFGAANEVVLSQLKYSTRNPEKEWTAARLYAGKGGKRSGSVIHRLADSFKAYYDKYGRDAVLEKLRLKLVSNRPVNGTLLNALNKAQMFLSGHPSKTTSDVVLKQLAGDEYTEIQRLLTGSKLRSYDFTDFLRIIDFSDCGESSRLGQRIKLVEEIGRFGPGEVHAQYVELNNLILDRMMPETQRLHTLTKHDICPVFGLSNYSQAFPAPPKIERPPHIIKRAQVNDFSSLIASTEGKPVYLHSGGGMGKTVIVQMIEENLPPHSVVIVFDCYGNGTYRNPDDIRHIHRRAIPQMTNELAARTGGPLLLRFDMPSEDLLREFYGRVQTAVSLVRKENPEALVVIAVDAADNSLHAAAEKHQESFINDLMARELPDGMRLVVSCRTENLGLLRLPRGSIEFELGGLSLQESSEHLKMYFSNATDQQAAEFHKLTRGVPRTQGYQLDFHKEGLDAVLSPLRPDGKSLDEIIDRRLRDAAMRNGVPNSIDRIREALIALPRPVPMAYAASLAGVSESTIQSFCVDVGFGLVPEDTTVSFRDQDFEDHLRARVEVNGLYGRIADLLFEKRNTDRYSAYHLDKFMVNSGRFSELFTLALEENVETIPSDPVERQEIRLNRIRSAVRFGTGHIDKVSILKLLFVAAETVKTADAVEKLISNNTDLAEKFGDPLTVQRLHLNINEGTWPVPILYQCAAVLSRFDSTKHKADEYMKSARSWMNWRNGVSKEKWHEYDVRNEDIANGAEAVLRLAGAERAAGWLAGWTPREIRYECAYLVASSVLRVDGISVLNNYLSDIPVRADIALVLLRAYQKAGASPPIWLIEGAAKVWDRFGRKGKNPEKEILNDGIILCEMAAREKSLQKYLDGILEFFALPLSEHSPSLYGEWLEQFDSILRHRAIRAAIADEKLTLECFLPDKYKGEDNKKEREYREFKNTYGALIPAYTLRADTLLGNISGAEVEKRFKECFGQLDLDYEISIRHDSVTIYRLMMEALADTVLFSSSDPATWFAAIEKAIIHEGRGGHIMLRLSLANKASLRPDLHAEALRLLDAAYKDLKATPMTAEEQIDTLIKCSRIAISIDHGAAKYYFDRAVESASEIDEEAPYLLSCLAEFAPKAALAPGFYEPEVAYQYSMYAEDSWNRIYDSKHFPWWDIVKGIIHLDPASAFAILSRWDDRGVLAIDGELYNMLATAAQAAYISPEQAYSLGILAAPHDYRYGSFATNILDTALASGDRARVSQLLSMMAADIQLYARIEDRKDRADKIVSWAREHGFERSPGAETLAKLVQFLDGIQSKKEDSYTQWKATNEKKEPDWDSIIGSRSFTSPEEIEAAIDTVRNFEEYGRIWTEELLRRIQKNCTPKDYTAQLDALLKIDSERLPTSYCLDAFKGRFTEWSVLPAVRQWKKEKAKIFIEKYASDLFSYGRFASHSLKQFKEVFEVPEAEIFELIVGLIPDFINESATAIYEVLQQIVPSLSPAEAKDILDWEVKRLSSRIPDDFGDGPWRDELRPPRDATNALPMFIWGLLGHPDKRVRWRTAHAVRRMIRLGHGDIVAGLLPHVHDQKCPAFRDATNYFFGLSARLWVFILLDRLVKEAPEIIKTHFELIAKEALEPETPHALIRYFAKSTALALNKNFPGITSKETVNLLEAVGRTPFPILDHVDRVGPLQRDDHQDFDRNARFHINGLDTLPYWYQPLGNYFGGGSKLVSSIAERWICDKWGFTKENVQNDRRSGRRGGDWNLYYNDHGSEPTIEDLQTYLEWHAMFCAADELLSKQPLMRGYWEEDTYQGWLKGWAVTSPVQWLADMRDPVPLVPIYWSIERPDGDDWEKKIPEDAFNPLLGLVHSDRPGFLVLNGSYRRAISDSSESMNIESALVTPETASALLRALQTAGNPNDYRIPPEGDNLEISEGGFKLEGWLRYVRIESGLDRKDPLRNDLSGSYVAPGLDFSYWADLVCSPDHKYYWPKGHENEPVMIFECWDDLRESEGQRIGFYTDGYRLWVRIKSLLAYLHDRNHYLIVKCMIHRWTDKKGIHEYVPGKAKIYIIRPDGTIETLRGCYRIGETPC